MAEIRWVRVIIAFLICAAILLGFKYWEAQNDPLSKIDIDLALQGCAVNFSPDGSSEIIKFGDARCPK